MGQLKKLNCFVLGYVHTNPFSYTSVFDRTKTDTNIRVHTSVFDSFPTVDTSYKKTIRFRSPWETVYRVHDVSVFENLSFRRFRRSTPIRKASVFESLQSLFLIKIFYLKCCPFRRHSNAVLVQQQRHSNHAEIVGSRGFF